MEASVNGVSTRSSRERQSELPEGAEEDLLAFYRSPPSHRRKLRSTNPLERLNKEIGRRSDVVGIFPNDASAIRLIGAMLIEQNDEWLVCRRYLSEGPLALVLGDQGDERREKLGPFGPQRQPRDRSQAE